MTVGCGSHPRVRRTLAAITVPLATVWIVAIAGRDAVAGPSAQGVPQPVIVDPNPVDWTPNVLDGIVEAFAQVGNTIVVGGTFTQVQDAGSATVLDRTDLFAFDATTGAVSAGFAPTVDGDVDALAAAPDGKSVFVGGSFTTVDGVPARGLAKLDLATGQAVKRFSAATNGSVRALVSRGDRLYVGGGFTSIGGVPRSALAAVDAATGTVDPNLSLAVTGTHHGLGAPTVSDLDVTADASRLVLIGNFDAVGGLRRVQLALIDLGAGDAPATVANWRTGEYVPVCYEKLYSYMRGVGFSPDGTYFVVVAKGSGRYPKTLCDTAARWETGASGGKLHPTWIDRTGGDSLLSVAVTGVAVYVGGHQRWQNNAAVANEAAEGAVPRPGIAALDPQNGVPYRWNPTKDRGFGTDALLSTPDGLLVGSDTTQLGHEYHARLGMFPVAGGEVPPVGSAPTLPGTLFRALTDGSLAAQPFDGTTAGSPLPVPTPGVDWTQARGTFAVNGTVYAGWSDGEVYGFPFDGTTLGSAHDVIASGGYVVDHWIDFADATGTFWWGGRLYYTRDGDRNLHYRSFSPESELIGSREFVASRSSHGLNWSAIRGMTEAGGYVFYATVSGELHRIELSPAGKPVRGTDALIGGPSVDGRDWSSNGLFVLDT